MEESREYKTCGACKKYRSRIVFTQEDHCLECIKVYEKFVEGPVYFTVLRSGNIELFTIVDGNLLGQTVKRDPEGLGINIEEPRVLKMLMKIAMSLFIRGKMVKGKTKEEIQKLMWESSNVVMNRVKIPTKGDIILSPVIAEHYEIYQKIQSNKDQKKA